jgi:class 3 adenylate cyclase
VSAIRPADPRSVWPVADTFTILFSDVENSTQLFERLGDIKAQEIIRSHNGIMRWLMREHGGFEVKTTGDGFMVAFPSARQSLLCAIDAQRKIMSPNGTGAVPIRVRIGIHTGEVISESGDFFGKCVIIAARITSLAKGAEILVSSTTKELIESACDDIHFDGGRALALKGLSSIYTIYRAVW